MSDNVKDVVSDNENAMKPDIFDKIMHLPGLRVFEPLYKKYKEVLLYLFFGVLTTIVSIASYAFFIKVCGIHELISNVLSWILAVAFAFFTNRIWVFAAPTKGAYEFLKQVVSFAGGRVFTLAVEEVVILVFDTLLHFNSVGVKVVAQVIVVVLNYVVSKLFVFKRKENE